MWGKSPLFSLWLLSLVFSVSNAQIGMLLEGFGYLYSAYEFTSKNFGNVELEPSTEEIYYKSLKKDLRDLKINLEKMEHHLPKEVNIHDRLYSLSMKFKDIDRYYNEYINYKQNKSRYELATLEAYVQKTTEELPIVMNKIYDDVIDLNKNSLATLMETYINNLDPYCERTQSRQRYFYDFFRFILSYEIKSIVILKHAYKLKYNNTNDRYVQERRDWRKSVRKVIKHTMKEFKSIISRSERDMWKCDPIEHVENKTFVELKLFQRVLYQGWDFTENMVDYLKIESCPAPSAQGVEPICNPYSCSSNQRHCSNVVGCKALEYEKPITTCLLKSQNQRRRYSSVNDTSKYRDEFSFTQKIIAPSYCDKHSYRQDFMSSRIITVAGVEHNLACDCICDELKNSDRYISLEPAISDIENNFVITGVRFVLVNHTLHIQIQQGKLKQYGSIGSKSVKWKDIETVSRNSSQYKAKIANFTADKKTIYEDSDRYDGWNQYKLAWNETRGLYLDDMDLKKNEVVVGVKFVINWERRDDSRYLQLDIMAMNFNHSTGQLNLKNYYWHGSKQPIFNRTQLKLEEYDTPTSFDDVENKPDGVAHKYAKFTPSAYASKDAGQSTLPFIDIQPVVSDPPVPLSGISMDIKRHKKSGGYLILKTKTYDVLWEFNSTTRELE